MPQPTRQATLAAIDERIYRSFRSVLHEREDVDRLIVGITRAQHWWAAAGLAATIADRERRIAWTHANAALGAAWAAAKLISRTVGRPRPNLADCRPARHNTDRESFPSTHATTAFAAAAALPPLLPRTPLILLAITTATGRLLLGEHYPSDIAAGAVLGTAVGGTLRALMRRDRDSGRRCWLVVTGQRPIAAHRRSSLGDGSLSVPSVPHRARGR